MQSSTDKNKSSAKALDTLSKAELHPLADSLQSGESGALEKCIAFILADTKGLWHGRGGGLDLTAARKITEAMKGKKIR